MAEADFFVPTPCDVMPRFPLFMQTLGSMSLAHPPIAPYTVTAADAEHPFTSGIEPFESTNELYLAPQAIRRSRQQPLDSGNADPQQVNAAVRFPRVADAPKRRQPSFMEFRWPFKQ